MEGKTCEQLLEKFWGSNGMNIEEEYELTSTQKLNSKPEALNQILSEREQLMEYESESALRLIMKFIIVLQLS
ncbi:MAG: hypothetical protein MJE68_07780 [Proteobacteria bacterium]|nr:hypothetical protein [Pseudomonadota bacterium]